MRLRIYALFGLWMCQVEITEFIPAGTMVCFIYTAVAAWLSFDCQRSLAVAGVDWHFLHVSQVTAINIGYLITMDSLGRERG